MMNNQFRNALDYLTLPSNLPGLDTEQRDLYRTLYAALSFVPTLLAFIALGFWIIYLLGTVNLLDSNDSRLLIVSAVSALASILHFPLFSLIRRARFNETAAGLLAINSLTSCVQILLWKDIQWLPIVVSAAPTLLFVTQRGLQRNYRIGSLIYGIINVSAILLLDRVITFERMVIGNSLAQMAAISIYIMVLTAIAVLVLMNSRINFHTISGRLVVTFTFVALLSSLATLIIAALANLYFDRQKVFQELNASSSVRTLQIEVALDELRRDTTLTFNNAIIDQHIQYLLTNKAGTQIYQNNFDLVQAYLLRQQTQSPRYQEVLLVDKDGISIYSTKYQNTGKDFSKYDFFQNARIGINYAVEYNFPTSFDQSSIILIRPFIYNGFLSGAIIARTGFDSIKQILAAKTGVGATAETYLAASINGQLVPISNTRAIANSVNTQPAEQAINQRVNQGFGVWNNYTGKSVLGSFVRIPALKTVLIAEIEQNEVTQKTFNISLINAIIGLFTLVLTFVIVLITSSSISLPIVNMAQKATDLANGNLATRMQVDRQDEIGTLAASFNSMAGELQSQVKTLEQKVEDRTQDLQKQAKYLRVASEVARDATTASNLDDLLNRSAELVLERFGFYHTGIFLLDEQKEFAILRASPTDAGREMLSRNHRLRVGQVGIVGNVAASGLPRIALDTEHDSAYFNNPLLPGTRSEMALPLKTGNQLIGVFDVQSDQPDAFSQDDIGILQIMADQLALAIQRLRLTLEQEKNLQQLEKAYQNFTFSSWSAFIQDSTAKQGYTFDGLHINRLSDFPLESQEILSQNHAVVLPATNKKDPNSSSLAVPLKLRNQIIGILTIQFNTKTITSDTISLVEESATRLAIALENARLYTETQKNAERERMIGEVTNRLTTSVNIETILRTTVQEIGRMLPGAEVVVKLDPASKEPELS